MELLQEFPPPGTNARGIVNGPAGGLEVIVASNSNPIGIVIICHPHPGQGGTMDNKVVTTIHKSFAALGYSSVRFNYRGIGNSKGESRSNLHGEVADTEAILAWTRENNPETNITIVGFSYGGYVAAAVTNRRSDIDKLLLVAPAAHYPEFAKVNFISCPCYVIIAEADEVIPENAILIWFARLDAEKHLLRIPNAGHFFHGELVTLRQVITKNLC